MKKGLLALTLLGLLVWAPNAARADTPCGSWSFDSTNQLGGFTQDVTVTCTGLTSGNVTLEVVLGSNSSGLTPLGIDFFAYDATNTFISSNDSTPEKAWGDAGSPNADGFGAFTTVLQGSSGDATDIIFTLNGPASNFTEDTLFAVHVRYGVCSGWASNGTLTGEPTPEGNCSGSEVPEPASLTLLGTGLLGLGGMLRKKLRKKA